VHLGPRALAARLAGGGSLREVRGALAGSVFVSFTGQALLAVSGILVARLLGPEDRGRLALVVLVPVLVVQFVHLGIPLGVTYFVARGADARRMLLRLRGSIAAQAVVGCVLTAAGFGVLAAIDSLHARAAAVAAVLALPGMLLIGYGLGALQGARHYRVFNVMRQAPAALYVLAVIGLYAAAVDSVFALTIAWAASYVLVGAAAFGWAIRLPSGGDDPPSTRELARFGVRGLVGASSPLETYRLDQVMIGIFLTPVSLGLYVVGLAFTNLPQFIGQSVGMVAYPHIAATQDRNAAWRAVKEYVLATSALCLAVCGILILLADRLIVLFFGEAFSSATNVTRVLLVAAAFASVRRVLGDTARGIGMPGATSLAEVGAWVALVPSLAIAIPLWGLVGVAVAMTVSYAVSLALLIALVVRHKGGLTGKPGTVAAVLPDA
jgi:O-antigen/teichoic acid export membrane protein